MKIIDCFKTSIIEIKRNFKYLFMFFISFFCLVILIISLTISFTYKNRINTNKKYNPLLNMVSVDFDFENIKEEDILDKINKLKKINHVTSIIHQKYYNSGGTIDEDKHEIISLQPLSSEWKLPSSTYNKPLKEDEIIIPKKFYKKQYNWLEDDIDEKDIIDGDTLVNKTISIYVDVID